MEAPQETPLILHAKSDSCQDRGPVAETGIKAHSEVWDVGRRGSWLRKCCCFGDDKSET